MRRSLTRIRTSHVGRLPPPKGWADMPARLAGAEITDPVVIAAKELGRAHHVGHVPPDQTAATDLATKAVPSLSRVTSSRSAVNHLLKSVVREIRTLRSVGTGGWRPPPVTRWAASRDVS